MRLGRLVAAGLVAGVVAGFVGALLRPRTVRTYGIDTGRGAGVDVVPARTAAVPAPTAVTPHRRLDADAAAPSAVLATAGAATPSARARGADG
jgi:hypothetical protein